MKSKPHLNRTRVILAVFSWLTLMASSALAANSVYIWTSTAGGASITDGSGGWSDSSANWLLNGTGPAVNWPNTATTDASIGNGGAGGTITLSGEINCGNLTFSPVSSPYLLSSGTLNLNGGLTASNNATISSGLILPAGNNPNWTVSASKTLMLTGGTITRNAGATLNIQGTGTVSASSESGITSAGDSSLPTQNGSSIIGPWITTGTGASTAYGVLVGGSIVPYTSATAQAWSGTFSGTSYNYDINASTVQIFGASTRSCNTVRYIANGACTVTLGNGNSPEGLVANGIINASSAGSSGGLTFDTTSTTASSGLKCGPNQEMVLIAASADIVVSARIHDYNNSSANPSSYTIVGPNKVTFSNAGNDYTGNTYINSGTLALTGAGTIADSANIVVGNGATFDVSGMASTFSLGAAQKLLGGGTVNGSVSAAGGGAAIFPGTQGTANTLTFNNNLDLSPGGAVYFDVSTNHSGGNDQIVVGGNLTLSSSDVIHINPLAGAANLDVNGAYVLFACSNAPALNSQPQLVWDASPGNQAGFILTTIGNNVVLTNSTTPLVGGTVFTPASPVFEGRVVTLSALVTGGAPPYTYNWQRSINGGSSWTDLGAGNGDGTYTLDTTGQGGTSYQYRLAVADSNSALGPGTAGTLQVVVPQTYIPPASERMDINLDASWRFIRQDVAGAQDVSFDDSSWTNLNLPHTWNNLDGQDGGNNYYRGIGWYRRHYTVPGDQTNREFFLRFEGANLVADVHVNGSFVGEHQGGYSAFAFDVTPYMIVGGDNVIAVKVNNAVTGEVCPDQGDFTFFGGLYRNVHLLVTDPVQVTPLDYGSPGVFLKPTNVSSNSSDLQVTTVVSNALPSAADVTVRAIVTDATTNIIATLTNVVMLPPGSVSNIVASTVIAHPHLWDGRYDPYLYRTYIEVYRGTNLVDLVSQPLGFRWFRMDPANGFFLNGRHYDLHGVSLHQDWLNCGNALTNAQRDTNFMFIKEIGATVIRMPHYQHNECEYELADKDGICVWTEIPLVGGVTQDTNYYGTTQQQLRELIRQNYNHPSIICWGMYNELPPGGNYSLVQQDVAIAHQEDTTRPTTSASMTGMNYFDGDANYEDVNGFNEYFGWYQSPVDGIGAWADALHAANPTRPIGVSEYGAGASIYQHSEDPVAQDGSSGVDFHPMEWQNAVHENNWAQMKTRPFLWCKIVWNMFDFASDGRDEGDHAGRNDKGLVTYDRKVRKDAFYFYKANWTTNPMVYITGCLFTNRTTSVPITAKVYANCDSVELFLNGVSQGAKASTDDVFTWPVTLLLGTNQVQAIGTKGGIQVTNSLVWIGQPTPVSQDKPIAASSVQSGHDATFGNDVSRATRWSASDGSYPQWWRVDLGASTTLSNAVIHWYNGRSRAYQYRIEVSNDDTNYATVVDKTGNSIYADPTVDTFNAVGRFIRIYVTGTTAGGGYASFYDCQLNVGGASLPSPPLAPSTLTANAISSGQIDLSWTASSGAIAYNVRRAETNGGPYTMIASSVAGTSYSDTAQTGLMPSTTYYYVVSAVNSAGESTNSPQASATTTAPLPLVLVDWWKFDETNGVIAADSVGNNDGTLSSGANWVSGLMDNAVSLDGSSTGYVTLPGDSVSSLHDFSITAWLYVNANATWARLFDFGSGTGAYMFLAPASGGNTVRYAITTSGNGSEQRIDSPAILPTGGWHHIAVTLSGTSGILYLDGTPVGTNNAMTLRPSSLGNTTQNYIGKSQWPNDPCLNGMVDDLRIYSGALTAAQVKALANPSSPAINHIMFAAGSLVFSGTNGFGGGTYYILSSTSLALPLADWTPVSTNSYDANGDFVVTNSILPDQANHFFVLKSEP